MSRTVAPKISVVTFAHVDFQFAIRDAEELLRQYDATTGRRNRTDVFKRAALIMTVTAWESFIEDSLRRCATERIEKAASPTDIQGVFNLLAHSWLEHRPKPPELANWTGEGWKAIVKAKLDDDLRGLNSPTGKNVRELSKRYFGEDLTREWHWARTTSTTASNRLDALIRLRGDVVHRGRGAFSPRIVVQRRQVMRGISLVKHLVRCTERALDITPKRVSLNQVALKRR